MNIDRRSNLHQIIVSFCQPVLTLALLFTPIFVIADDRSPSEPARLRKCRVAFVFIAGDSHIIGDVRREASK